MTVGEMEGRMSPRELRYWQLFYETESQERQLAQ
jgi:hypothetical protein